MCKRALWLAAVAAALSMLLPVATNAAPASTAKIESYGPCCPYVTGREQPWTAKPGSYWAAGAHFQGPTRVCRTPRPVSVVYEGQVRRVDAIDVNGTILVPQRVLAIAGATVDYLGERKTVASLGSRKFELTPGHYQVMVSDGQKTQPVKWNLCPRIQHGITYVPVRAAAEALGLTAQWQNRGIVLSNRQPTLTAMSTAQCPADEVEEELGVKLLRGPINGPFGAGIGVVSVRRNAAASQMGLRARDVILSANGKRVQCPKDLQAAMATSQSSTITVSRRGQKLTLPAKR
ncbi:MAG: copper amine oxidase N-terminal domain-containing protein [Armatimonadota bacterium]